MIYFVLNFHNKIIQVEHFKYFYLNINNNNVSIYYYLLYLQFHNNLPKKYNSKAYNTKLEKLIFKLK